MNLSPKFRYCIIAGAPRSGTTSLYNYIAHHPQVNPSSIKQTGYFLDSDYFDKAKLPGSVAADKDQNFDALFEEKNSSNLKIEATPDYLYSEGTAKQIHKSLGSSVALIFILRNPIDQFVSVFHHYKRLG